MILFNIIFYSIFPVQLCRHLANFSGALAIKILYEKKGVIFSQQLSARLAAVLCNQDKHSTFTVQNQHCHRNFSLQIRYTLVFLCIA